MTTSTERATTMVTVSGVAAEREFFKEWTPDLSRWMQLIDAGDAWHARDIAEGLEALHEKWADVTAPSARTAEILTMWLDCADSFAQGWYCYAIGANKKADEIFNGIDADAGAKLMDKVFPVVEELGLHSSFAAAIQGVEELASTTTTVRPTTTTVNRALAYKESCTEVKNYKVLKKNPDKYAGQRLAITGKITQIFEEDGVTFMLVSITKVSYGWEDPVAVFYEGTIDAYEDDIVSAWGECSGSYEYTSVAGWQLSVPGMLGKYVEKVK